MPLLLTSPTDYPSTQPEAARLEVLHLPQLPTRVTPAGSQPDILWIVGRQRYYGLDRNSPTFVHYLHLLTKHEFPDTLDPEESLCWSRLDGLPLPSWRDFRAWPT